MSANGKITLAWADGEHTFNLAKIGQVFELEDKCASGVSEIFTRLREGRWKFNDVREPIRLGLVGGGMVPTEALKLVQRYVDERPWAESVPIATVVMMAALIGVPGDEVGKLAADRAESEADGSTATAASSDPQSTGSVPDSDGIQDKLMKPPSGNSPPASKDTTPPTEPSPHPTP